jgi:HlyD family secretion protein
MRIAAGWTPGEDFAFWQGRRVEGRVHFFGWNHATLSSAFARPKVVMMRLLVKVIAGLLLVAIVGWFAVPALLAHWQSQRKLEFRQALVSRGKIIAVVNSTGTVQPVLTVQVGCFVSGPILHVYVDFNAKVKRGQVMAEIDPLICRAQRNQAKATLACAEASLLQAMARLEQTKGEWERAKSLRPLKAIAGTDYDLAKANYDAAKASVAAGMATIEQNKAALELAEINLGYTVIKSPVDGVVIDRKVDPGQTVAAQFQTPEMFKVAPDMEKRMFVFASVDEADIGLIRAATDQRQPVTFTVDAYPNDLFQGKVYQARLNPTTVQNVVTYPVVVEAGNAELKLLPGMTANLSFQVGQRERVLRVPNAALRFYPKPRHVRPEDRGLLEGEEQSPADTQELRTLIAQRSAKEKTDASRSRSRRHVWIVQGDFLKAVEINVGISDSKYTEVVSGSLKEGQEVVTGLPPQKL